MIQAYEVFAILLMTLGLFIWGYWRYDIVAMLAMMSLVVLKILPFQAAFLGFSNPAVITVACVMIITAAITQSGVIDEVVQSLLKISSSPLVYMIVLLLVTAFLSAFMNNIGALALMMPVAIKASSQLKQSPSLMLMPLAFASVLGGLCTAIGTPPNLLISAYREQVSGHSFQMFDFTAVGVCVAFITVLFIGFLGWRVLPERRKSSNGEEDVYQISDYITEVRVPEGSRLVDLSAHDIELEFEGDFAILGLIRGSRKYYSLPRYEVIRADDILIIEADHVELEKFVKSAKLELSGVDHVTSAALSTNDIGLMEAVISPGARIERRSWQQLRIRARYQLNLLAIARRGQAFKTRLSQVELQGGDVVLVQGHNETMRESLVSLGLLPLVERGIQVGSQKNALLSIAVFFGAIAMASLNILPVQIALTLGVLILVMTHQISPRQVYKDIDWPVIVLLAAMIPVGNALQLSGATDLIVKGLLNIAGTASPSLIIGLLFIITMTLSDVMNNAATAVVMAPVAVSLAHTLNLNIDPFLMTVAVSSSCSFLTPISHQNNTLVMGPGGYKFTDYLRLGLPVEILVFAMGLPLILWIWPIK